MQFGSKYLPAKAQKRLECSGDVHVMNYKTNQICTLSTHEVHIFLLFQFICIYSYKYTIIKSSSVKYALLYRHLKSRFKNESSAQAAWTITLAERKSSTIGRAQFTILHGQSHEEGAIWEKRKVYWHSNSIHLERVSVTRIA